MTIPFRALAGILLGYGMLASALAQSPQRLPGSWFAFEEKFGLVFGKNEGEAHFAYGNCDRQRSRPQASLTLEIDPKMFGDAVAAGKYIIVGWTDYRAKGDLIVEGLSLNEVGPYLWSLLVTISLETLDQWRAASHLQLTIGVREPDGSGYKPRHSYVMPDDNRQIALASFIRSCSEHH